MLPIVQVINTNKLRWFGHDVMRRGGRVHAKRRNEVKDEGKETKRKTMTKVALDIDKEKNTSMKEVLERKCFTKYKIGVH